MAGRVISSRHRIDTTAAAGSGEPDGRSDGKRGTGRAPAPIGTPIGGIGGGETADMTRAKPRVAKETASAPPAPVLADGGGPSAGTGTRPGVLLFCFLLAAQALFFSGRFHSLDEMALLATTESMVRWHHTDINSMAWEQWFLTGPDQQGMFNAQGDLYGKKAPLVAWLCAPLYAAADLLHAHPLPASLLLNALVVAATALVVYRFAARLGSSPHLAVVSALLFALGTHAFVYARFLFSEPLSGLGLLLAVEGVWRYGHEEPSRLRALLEAGAGLGLAVLGNVVNLAFVPLLLLYLLLAFARARKGMRAPAALLVPVALAVAAWVIWNAARFGSPFTSGYHWQQGEGFSSPLWVSIPGLLLSPARGLLFFVPLSLLAGAGIRSWMRRDQSWTLLVLALIAAHLVVFGAWWMWWGGWCWGPRFLVPLTPFLPLLALPVLQAFPRAGPRRRTAILAVCAASVAVQILGAAVGFDEFELRLSQIHLATGATRDLYNYGWGGLWNPQLSPIGGHAGLLFSGLADLAWCTGGVAGWFLLVVLLGVLGLSGWALLSALRGRRPAAARPEIVGAAVVLGLGLLVWHAGEHPLHATYGFDPETGAAAVQKVARSLQPGDGVMAVRSLATAVVDGRFGSARIYGIPDGGLRDIGGADLDRFLDNATVRQRRLWLIVRSERDPFASRIVSRLSKGMRSPGWASVAGYRIALFEH